MKKLLLSAALVLLLTGVSMADEANGMSGSKKQSVILNVGGNFGKYDIKTDGEKFGDLHNQSNIGLTYFYNLEPMNNMFSVGGKFMVSNYGSRAAYRDADEYGSAKSSIALKPAYTFMAMGNANVYTIGKFSTNVNAGLGVSINTMRLKEEHTDFANPSDPEYNGKMSKTSTSYGFAYTIGLNETYAINEAWGVGLDVNYTSLGNASLKIKDEDETNKIKAKSQNNDFGIGLSVKYSF
ncbi:hypothetical protein ACFX5K_03220 [Rickettsiales bacterium LUAb2]